MTLATATKKEMVPMAESASKLVGKKNVLRSMPPSMGAEDFPYFTTEPAIRSVYFSIGGTAKEDFEAAEKGGKPIPSHHSPLFKIVPEPSVRAGIEATVLALKELMPKS